MRTAIHKGRGSAIAGGILLAIALTGFGVVVTADVANATGNHDCVPSEAWTEVIPGTPGSDEVYETVVLKEAGWQRYSHKGVWGPNTVAPPFPSDKWQANTASDPHGVGVEGAYFRSNGNSGHGDWFYLEATPEITKQVLVTEAVPPTEETTVEHPAVVCEPPVEEPPVEEPPVEEPPVEEPPVEQPPVENPPVVAPPAEPTLPHTGPNELFGLIAAAAAMLTASGAIIVRSIRKKLAVPTN